MIRAALRQALYINAGATVTGTLLAGQEGSVRVGTGDGGAGRPRLGGRCRSRYPGRRQASGGQILNDPPQIRRPRFRVVSLGQLPQHAVDDVQPLEDGIDHDGRDRQTVGA